MVYADLVGAENPEENKKIQALDEKVVIFRDFQQKSETKWCCGTILQPRENRELSGTLILQDEQTLKVIGRIGIFSGSTFWKRV